MILAPFTTIPDAAASSSYCRLLRAKHPLPDRGHRITQQSLNHLAMLVKPEIKEGADRMCEPRGAADLCLVRRGRELPVWNCVTTLSEVGGGDLRVRRF
jgi:hypothetical protein